MSEAATVLGEEAAALFEEYLGKIERCVALLDDARLWRRPGGSGNAVGNLLLHLEGNLSQWVLAALGGEGYERRRRAEFAADRGPGSRALLARLRAVVERCVDVALGLDEAALRGCHQVQGYRRSGFGALLHAVEHMSYHTGQIVLLTKQLADPGAEIEFYPHLA